MTEKSISTKQYMKDFPLPNYPNSMHVKRWNKLQALFPQNDLKCVCLNWDFFIINVQIDGKNQSLKKNHKRKKPCFISVILKEGILVD